MFKFLRRTKPEEPLIENDEALEASSEVASTQNDPQKILARLEWTVIKRLDGQLQGDYRTLFRGSGMELADLREYLPHDDVRHIDWNVTARMQDPYVREHQEDRDMTAWFVMDLSGSVGRSEQLQSKRHLATTLVAVLARILTRRGNPVGAMLFASSPQKADVVIPARTGKRHVLHLMDRIAKSLAPDKGEETHLGPMLLQAQASIKKRSTVFVISDFISQPGWEGALSQLARRHEVIAVRLRDPIEMNLQNMGLVVVQDAETGEQLLIDANDRGFRDRFAALAKEREEYLLGCLTRSGVDCLELQTDEPLDEAILQFIQLRKRRGQWATGSASANAHREMHRPSGVH